MNKKMIPNTNSLVYERWCDYTHGSENWRRDKTGKTLGSSEAAAVFPTGVSTTFTHTDLKKKLRGERLPPPTDFMQNLFDLGNEHEPIFIDEMRDRTGCCIIEGQTFRGETVNGLTMVASPDGIMVDYTQTPTRLALLEIKFRTTGPDAGWPEEKDGPRIFLGLTVWVQVQHQMWVTGIPVAVVYSGNRDGDRRAWIVHFCPDYISELFLPELQKFTDNPDERAYPGKADTIKRQLLLYKRGTSRRLEPWEMPINV